LGGIDRLIAGLLHSGRRDLLLGAGYADRYQAPRPLAGDEQRAPSIRGAARAGQADTGHGRANPAGWEHGAGAYGVLEERRPGVGAPGASIPADGEVDSGESDVNEAMITGESRPVKKAPGERVIAGAINGGTSWQRSWPGHILRRPLDIGKTAYV
jgi:hypothetical protein